MRRPPLASAFLSLPPEAVDPATEAAVFSSLKLRNGAFKTTAPGRFAELDAFLEPFLVRRAGRIRQVLDVGASSGCTTIDLARTLTRLGIAAEVTATDLCLDAVVVQLSARLRVLADRSGWPLQYEVAGRAVRPWPRRLDWVWPAGPARLLARRAVGAAVRRRLWRGEGAPLRLVSPRVRGFPNVRLLEHDLAVRMPELEGRFDLVRAANVLNGTVLGPRGLARAARNLRRMLAGPGALLLVLRTAARSGVHSGTLFELDPDGALAPILRFGGGSDVEPAFLAPPPVPVG